MHEPPWLEDGDPTVLQPGMIVSNEPGLYVPGHAGYRISDSMLVTGDRLRAADLLPPVARRLRRRRSDHRLVTRPRPATTPADPDPREALA